MGTIPEIDPGTRVAAVAMIALLVAVSSLSLVSAQATVETVDLGTADPFAILAGSTITNTGPSVINGNIGLHPGTSITGFNTATVNGETHVANEVARLAKVDLTNAYNDAAGRADATTLVAELGDKELFPGVYGSPTFELTGTLTLDAQGNESAVWIFQMESTLTTAAASSVVLKNEAQACNVFWQVGSSATLGTGTKFKGNILAHTSISMNDGATLDGRALANGGAVTLINNVISIAECALPEEPPADDPPADDPPADDPPADDPPADDPPADDPPADDPPADDPPAEAQQPPACPGDLRAEAQRNENVVLSWTASTGADSYHIYRATGDGEMEHMAEVTSTTYTDADTEAETTYTYEVTAANEAGEAEGCDQVEVTAIPFFGSPAIIAMAALGSIGIVAALRARRN